MNLYRNLSRLSEDHWTRPLEYLWLYEEFWDSAFLIGYYRRISKQWKRKLQLSESQFVLHDHLIFPLRYQHNQPFEKYSDSITKGHTDNSIEERT